MPGGFFPHRDALLLLWADNFYGYISTGYATYGLTEQMAEDFDSVRSSYATALSECDPGDRSKTRVVAKNAARTALKSYARLLAKKVYATPTVTDAQLTQLGLTVRKTPTPVPPPADSPEMDLVSVTGNIVKVRLHGATMARGKPAGVLGASLFTHVGTTPPENIEHWVFQGNTTRTKVELAFAPSGSGQTVWITAFWYNRKGQSGPACEPMSVNLPASLALPQSVSQSQAA
jgi:hypothetical protein